MLTMVGPAAVNDETHETHNEKGSGNIDDGRVGGGKQRLIAAACGELDVALHSCGSQRSVTNGAVNGPTKLKCRNVTPAKCTKGLPDGVYSNGNGIYL
uniref:Uncharacterized protein n=1 Tax=Quercus lobata TaxID=97700 RepID=A0A7N2RD28_QUELO